MKTLLLLSFVAGSLGFTSIASAGDNMSPECRTWKTKWDELSKKPVDVDAIIAHVQTYPGAPGVPAIGSRGDVKAVDEVTAIMVQPECARISLYDAEKTLLAAKLTSKQQNSVRLAIFGEIKKEAERKAPLLDLILMARTLEVLTDLPWFKVSDIQYFEFSRLSEAVRNHAADVQYAVYSSSCASLKGCTESQAKDELHRLRHQQNQSDALYLGLVRWASRIDL